MTPDKDEMEYIYFLTQLVNGKGIEGAALGIAKQTIDKGRASLSDRQREALDGFVNQRLIEVCVVCHQTIPWSERYEAMDTGRCAAHKPT